MRTGTTRYVVSASSYASKSNKLHARSGAMLILLESFVSTLYHHDERQLLRGETFSLPAKGIEFQMGRIGELLD
jgi:hypothetical protein